MLQASGGMPPYAWSTSTNYFPCPAGLSLSASGQLSGTPTNWGNQACFVQVTDSSSPPQTVKQVLTLFVISQLTLGISLPNPPSVRNFYSAFLYANGGFGPFTWTIQSGSLPPGLALTNSPGYSDATISGVPAARGTYNFTVQVADTGPPQQTATQPVSLTVFDYPEVTTQSLPLGLINKPYSATLQAIGGTPPYSWSVYAPLLPPGVTLDSSSGILSGTPTQSWDKFIVFTVTDSSVPPYQATGYLHLIINPLLSFTSPSTLFDAVQTVPYTYALPFQGGLPPYLVSVTGGALPPGISIAGSGTSTVTFSGSPSTAGTSNFTLSVQDSESPPVTKQQAFSIRVNPKLVLAPAQTPPAIVGLAYSFQFQATGGVPPLQWSSSPLSFLGLTIDPASGLMSGTPTIPGACSFGVTVQDSSNPYQTSTGPVSLQIYDRLRVATSVLPRIAPDSPVNMQLSGFGGTGNYVWSLSQGTLPTGLNLSAGGQISGQTSQTGSFPITLQLNDAGPPAQTATLATTLKISTALGRNDSPATATPLSNGTYQASISPFSDPPTGVPNPDTDYYLLTANPGATVTVEIKAQRLNPPSPLDSVLEIVDASNNRLSLCSNPPLYPNGPYTNPCLNDDLPGGGSTDSILTMQVPASNSGPLTFYAHVLDWRGDARPDFIYTITVTGAN